MQHHQQSKILFHYFMFDLKEKEQISQRIVKEGQEQDIQIYINLNQNQCDMGTKKKLENSQMQ
jgi:hypothetical protein